MNDDASLAFGSLLLFGALAWAISALTLHVVLRGSRRAMRATTLRARASALAGASVALGSSAGSCAVLLLTGESLPFSLGFRAVGVLLVWGLAALGALLVVTALAWARQWWMQLLTAALLALLGTGVLLGLIEFAGLRPSVHWRPEFVVSGCALMTLGALAALWTALGGKALDGDRRGLWALSGCAVHGLAWVVGSHIVMAAAGLMDKSSSFYLDQVPAWALSLLCGALMPMWLASMAVELELRRLRTTAGTSTHVARHHPRRRRRHRVSEL